VRRFGWLLPQAVLQQIARDDQLLNLARPIEDAKCPRMPEQALDGGAADDAKSAENLHRLIDDFESGLGREQFGDGRFTRDALPGDVMLPGGEIDQERGGVDAYRHGGKLPGPVADGQSGKLPLGSLPQEFDSGR
jgi:hypothetical protein